MDEVRIDIGCGRSKFKGTLGLDIVAVPGVDIVADLNHGLPLRDSSVDAVFTSHTLEHVENFAAVMEEVWRVCRPGALVHIWVPHASSSAATWTDPTHRRGLTLGTFDYFHPDNRFNYYSRARFEMVHARLRVTTVGVRRLGIRRSRRLLSSVIESVANHSRTWQIRAERWWGPLIGFDEARVVLRALKQAPTPAADEHTAATRS